MKRSRIYSTLERKMQLEELSKAYMVATERIHDEATALYESLHTTDGNVLTTVEDVYALLRSSRKQFLLELEMIIEAAKQFND